MKITVIQEGYVNLKDLKTASDKEGVVFYNNNDEAMLLTRYKNNRDCDVVFVNNCYKAKNVRYGNVVNGKVKNLMTPSVYGVGYIGVGDSEMYDENGKLTHCYQTWRNMLKRAYDPKYHEKYPTYIDCEVCPKWHNYQVFSRWYYKKYYEIPGCVICLDKDILNKGNKIYSPENCVFVPQHINLLFVKSDGIRGELPIGVSYHKQSGKYSAQLHINNAKKHLGLFSTPEQAFQAYKTAKEAEIQRQADLYMDYIPDELYQAMISYQVEIDD